jgi:hypothetical protein
MKLLITASFFISAACLLFLFGWQAPVNPAEGPYQFSKEIPIGTGVDANSYDPESGFVFASCGDGKSRRSRQNQRRPDGVHATPLQGNDYRPEDAQAVSVCGKV